MDYKIDQFIYNNNTYKFIDNTTVKYDYKIIYAQIQTNELNYFLKKKLIIIFKIQ